MKFKAFCKITAYNPMTLVACILTMGAMLTYAGGSYIQVISIPLALISWPIALLTSYRQIDRMGWDAE